MRVLIRHRGPDGQPEPARDQRLVVDTLRIGRGDDQDLKLDDLRIPAAGWTLRMPAAGRIEWRTLHGDGRVTVGRLQPGDAFDCGRHRLRIGSATASTDLVIEVSPLHRLRDGRRLRLAALRERIGDRSGSRRAAAWTLLIAILLIGLVIPAALRYGQAQPPRSPEALAEHAAARSVAQDARPWRLRLTPDDRLWTPGPSSPAHAWFQQDCGQCHEQPFVAVQDSSCRRCHEATASHVDERRSRQLHGRFTEARCADCHHEHDGAHGMAARQDRRCTDCHADPKARFADTRLEPVADFSRSHPPFTPRLARFDTAIDDFRWIESAADPGTSARPAVLPLPSALVSETSFKYPHDEHLLREGIDAPEGRRVLKCASCHEPDGSGIGFRPIRMESHCGDCHRLDFEPKDPSRLVPHGDEAAVVDTIRDYYARVALGGGVMVPDAPIAVQLRRRPGEVLASGDAMAALAWADRRSRLVIDEVFDRRVCSTCHTLDRMAKPRTNPSANPSAKPAANPAVAAVSAGRLALAPMPALPWRIRPIAENGHRLSQARPFPHAQHTAEACTSCHAATDSKKATDVLMPPISRCRDCHGDRGTSAKIQTVCTDCHGYHGPEAVPANDTVTRAVAVR